MLEKFKLLLTFKNPFIHAFNSLAGYVIKLEWFCEDEHSEYWYSSEFYGSGFAVNYMVDTALLLSGGQINQFHCFCKFLKLGKASPSTFYRNQKLYAIPAIEQCYNELRLNVISDMKKTDNIICGDCQLDSPGWSATKGACTFMNYENKKLISMEFGDKREVCFK